MKAFVLEILRKFAEMKTLRSFLQKVDVGHKNNNVLWSSCATVDVATYSHEIAFSFTFLAPFL